MTNYEVMRAWVKQHSCVEAWINRLKESTRLNFMSYAYHYFNWVKEHGGEYAEKEPEELLDLQEKTQGRDQFKQVTLLQQWLNQQKGRFGTKKTKRTAINSFYNHNHVPLPKDITYKIEGDRPAVEGKLTVEDFKKIVLSCNVPYQAVFMCMFQGALGEHEYEYFNLDGWEQVEPQLRKGRERLKIVIPGRKHKWMAESNYYTFIGKDAVECLRRYLSEERGIIKEGEPIFLGEKNEPLTAKALRAYFHRHAVKVGVIKQYSPICPNCGGETRRKRIRLKDEPQQIYYICRECGRKSLPKDVTLDKGVRYGVSPHELRDVFRSEWELSPAKVVCAEFFMGHKIDPNMYNKIMKLRPDWAEEQYALAEPYLNILSEEPRTIPINKVKHLEGQIEDAQSEIEELTLNSKRKDNRIKELEERFKPEQIEEQAQIIARQEQEIQKLKDTLDTISVHAENLSYQAEIFMQLMKIQYPNLEEEIKKFKALSPKERTEIIDKLLKKGKKEKGGD